jgi:O-antigen ligase
MNGYPINGRSLRNDTLPKRALFLGFLVVLAILVGIASSRLSWKIALGIVGGAILFALVYRNIHVGLILFLVLNMTIPQAGPSLDVGFQTPVGERGLHFNLHEIVITLVLLAWLLQIFFGKSDWKRKNPLVIPILLYVLTSIIACFTGLVNGGSFLVMSFRFVRTVLFVYIFFLLINNIKSRRQFQRFVVIIMICATAVAIFGLVQKAMGQAWAEMVAEKYFRKLGFPANVNYIAGESIGQAYRVNSTFLHPNILGGYLAFALPFFVSLIWYYRRWWARLLLIAGIGINVTCLFYTGSRAAWIGTLVVALAYVIFAFLDGRKSMLAVTVILVIVLVLVMFNPPEFVKKRFSDLSAKEAVKARVLQYRLAVDFFLEHPIFGLGMGMEGKRIVEENMRSMWVAVENAYLTYLISHGLVGLSAFLLVLLTYALMMVIIWRRAKGDDFLRYHSEAFFLGILGGFLIPNLFAAWLLFAIPMVTLFWFFIGISSCLNHLGKEAPGV